jgi:molecular chaperone DnaJ
VAPHDRFERDGFNVLSEVEIGYAQAVLGAEIEVETLHGKEDLAIPPGTHQGEQFRLKGKGVDRLGGSGRGDHIALARIRVPAPGDLSDEQRELLRKLAELEGRPVKEERGVLHRVRDLFGG